MTAQTPAGQTTRPRPRRAASRRARGPAGQERPGAAAPRVRRARRDARRGAGRRARLPRGVQRRPAVPRAARGARSHPLAAQVDQEPRQAARRADAARRAPPEERARALWERAAFIQTHEQNLRRREGAARGGGRPTARGSGALARARASSRGKEGDAAGRHARARGAGASSRSTRPGRRSCSSISPSSRPRPTTSARAYELLGTAAALEGEARVPHPGRARADRRARTTTSRRSRAPSRVRPT